MKRLSIDDNDNNDKGSKNILTLIERVLLFKQELDRYFFQNKIHLIKFHLNNICSIIMKNISDMQREIINAYPLFKTSNIVRLLGNFSDVMSTFIETKPQEFYREIKDTILDTWEKNQIQIKELKLKKVVMLILIKKNLFFLLNYMNYFIMKIMRNTLMEKITMKIKRILRKKISKNYNKNYLRH